MKSKRLTAMARQEVIDNIYALLSQQVNARETPDLLNALASHLETMVKPSATFDPQILSKLEDFADQQPEGHWAKLMPNCYKTIRKVLDGDVDFCRQQFPQAFTNVNVGDTAEQSVVRAIHRIFLKEIQATIKQIKTVLQQSSFCITTEQRLMLPPPSRRPQMATQKKQVRSANPDYETPTIPRRSFWQCLRK